MKDLIAKLEAATEGSRELDREIAEEALGLITEWESVGDRPQPTLMVRPLEKVGYSELPHFTTSLDAALTLVPEGLTELCVQTTSYSDGHAQASLCWGTIEPFDRDGISVWANTLPLALCIAALKARCAQ